MALDPERERQVNERADKLYKRMEGDPRRLAMMAAQFQLLAEGAQPEKIEVVGGVSAATNQPYVQFLFGGDFSIQQSPDEAYEFARNIQESAVNATYEAALFKFLQEVLDIDPPRAATVIGEMRDFRRDRWGSGIVPVTPEEPRSE